MADEAHDDEYADDPFGKELAESIKANEALLQGVRYDIGQRIIAAQAGTGEFPTAIELVQVKKLELQLEQDKLFAQARRMTRKRAS